jgi:predicted Zn-dependent protease
LLVALGVLVSGCASNLPANSRFWTLDKCTGAASPNIRLTRRDGSVIAVVPRRSCEAIASAAKKMQVEAKYPLAAIYLADFEEPNAFATRDKAGQSIAAVTFGMLIALGPDEDAWAGLLGHELAHHVQRHGESRGGAQTAAAATGQAAAQVIGSLVPGIGGFVAGSLGGTVARRAMYGAFTRPQEAEADALALQWMANAGYDPRGMLRLFSVLDKTSPGVAFLSTHPANEDRVQAVEQFISTRK